LADVASVHLLYILNNPLSGTDPSGYAGTSCEGLSSSDCRFELASGGQSGGSRTYTLGNNYNDGNGATRGSGSTGAGNERAERRSGPSSYGSAAQRYGLSVHKGGGDGDPGYFVPDADEMRQAEWQRRGEIERLLAGLEAWRVDRPRRNAMARRVGWELAGKQIVSVPFVVYFGAVFADVMYLGRGAAWGVGATTSVPNSARSGVAPVLQGQAGVVRSIRAAEARGETVVGSEITVDTAAGLRTRPDTLVRKPDGGLKFIESKCGPGACLNANQRAAFPQIEAGGAVPRGANAERAGLEPGKPLGPVEVQVDYW
jgi:hypothetical protein